MFDFTEGQSFTDRYFSAPQDLEEALRACRDVGKGLLILTPIAMIPAMVTGNSLAVGTLGLVAVAAFLVQRFGLRSAAILVFIEIVADVLISLWRLVQEGPVLGIFGYAMLALWLGLSARAVQVTFAFQRFKKRPAAVGESVVHPAS